MTKPIMLDASPLGRLCNPHQNDAISAWIEAALAYGRTVFLPEIADYELRREYLHRGSGKSLSKLEFYRREFSFAPIDSAVMLRAAELWAHSHRIGRPTAHPHHLDADVILAAQAEECDAIVCTENIDHLGLWVPVIDWRKELPA